MVNYCTISIDIGTIFRVHSLWILLLKSGGPWSANITAMGPHKGTGWEWCHYRTKKKYSPFHFPYFVRKLTNGGKRAFGFQCVPIISILRRWFVIYRDTWHLSSRIKSLEIVLSNGNSKLYKQAPCMIVKLTLAFHRVRTGLNKRVWLDLTREVPWMTPNLRSEMRRKLATSAVRWEILEKAY